MKVLALVLLPAAAGVLAFLLRSDPLRRALLVATSVAHAGVVAACLLAGGGAGPGEWLRLDALGLVFLAITSVLFVASAFYAVGYLRREGTGPRRDFEEGQLFADAPERVFVGCMLFFLAAMSLESKQWFLDPEIMVKAHYLGVRVLEMNVFARMRSNGLSHVRASHCLEFITGLLQLKFGGALTEWRRNHPPMVSRSGPKNAGI